MRCRIWSRIENVRNSDDIPDALLHVEGHFCLLMIDSNFKQHVLKRHTVIVRFKLRNGADCYSFTITNPPVVLK